MFHMSIMLISRFSFVSASAAAVTRRLPWALDGSVQRASASTHRGGRGPAEGSSGARVPAWHSKQRRFCSTLAAAAAVMGGGSQGAGAGGGAPRAWSLHASRLALGARNPIREIVDRLREAKPPEGKGTWRAPSFHVRAGAGGGAAATADCRALLTHSTPPHAQWSFRSHRATRRPSRGWGRRQRRAR